MKKLLLTTLILTTCLFAHKTEAAVSRVGVASFNNSTANTGTVAFNASSTSQLVVIGLGGFGAANYLTTNNLLVNGTAATIGRDDDASTGDPMCAMYYFVATTTGNHNITWDWAGASVATEGVTINVAFYTGVNTASPLGAAGGVQSGTPYSTGSLTATNGDMFVGQSQVFGSGLGTGVPWTNATRLISLFFNKEASSYADQATSGNITVSTTATGVTGSDGTGCISGFIVKQSAAAATLIPGPKYILKGFVSFIRGFTILK